MKSKISRQNKLLSDEESSDSEDEGDDENKRKVETSDSEGSDSEEGKHSNSEENSNDEDDVGEMEKEETKNEVVGHVIKMRGLPNNVKEVNEKLVSSITCHKFPVSVVR